MFCLPSCPANFVGVEGPLCDGRAPRSAGQTHAACVHSEGCVHTRQQPGNWLELRQQGHSSPPEGGAESSCVWASPTSSGASRGGHGGRMSDTRRGSIHEVGESSVAHTGRINRTLAGGSRSCRHTHLPPRLPRVSKAREVCQDQPQEPLLDVAKPPTLSGSLIF